ncbi:MAG: hypothetical protein ACLQBJ_02420 [Bryobacteraceae bacterium]
MRVLGALICCTLCLGAVDLDAVRKEPDLQKRCELALDAAVAALKDARALPTEGGSVADLKKDMDMMVQAVELSLQSLRDTGKRPSKLGKYYKKGELRTRNMLRQLENLVQAIAFDSRPPAEKARDRLVVLHDEFLFGVMSGQ